MRIIAANLVIFILATSVYAAAPAKSSKDDSSLEQDIIRGNITVSEWIDSAAESLDLFLTGRRLTKQGNKTKVRIENTTQHLESEQVDNRTHINLQLRLPNVERYFKVAFSSYDEQEQRSVRAKYLHQQKKEENLGATVGFFRSIGKVKTRFQPRIQLKKPLNVSHALSFETLADARTVLINPRVEFFADPDKGTGTFDQLNFTFPITRKLQFIQVNEGEYADKQLPHFTATNGLILSHIYTDRKFLTYSVLFDSIDTTSYHLNSYDLSIAWNETIYRSILHYQIAPTLQFARERGWKGRPGFTFTVMVDF